MNIIVYKLLFRNDLWNPKENITTLLINTFSQESMSIKNIIFSSFLYHLEHKSVPLFSKKNYNIKCIVKRPLNTKIQNFYSVIWINPFLSDFQKETFLLFFCKIQKIYYGFSRFIRIYKYKISNIVVNQDLFLNNLDPNHRQTFILFIHKSIYYFNIQDIYNQPFSPFDEINPLLQTPLQQRNRRLLTPITPQILNPKTNRMIRIGGRTYKNLLREGYIHKGNELLKKDDV